MLPISRAANVHMSQLMVHVIQAARNQPARRPATQQVRERPYEKSTGSANGSQTQHLGSFLSAWEVRQFATPRMRDTNCRNQQDTYSESFLSVYLLFKRKITVILDGM
jgi:hypothetical protein